MSIMIHQIPIELFDEAEDLAELLAEIAPLFGLRSSAVSDNSVFGITLSLQFRPAIKQIIHYSLVHSNELLRAGVELFQVGGVQCRELASFLVNKPDHLLILACHDAVKGLARRGNGPLQKRICLMLCDYAVADLTTVNANVLYELGIRHGARPHSTVLIFGKKTRLPFDVARLRGLPYEINQAGAPETPAEDRKCLADRLRSCLQPSDDSPLFQLLSGWPRPDIARLKTDEFRELVEYSRKYKDKLRAARRAGTSAVAQVEQELDVRDDDPAIIVDLLLSYRAVGNCQAMVDLVPRMSAILARSVLVREQLGFALNRLGRRPEAEDVLRDLIEEHGPSSETNGLLGRVYKDYREDAVKGGEALQAVGYLKKAIDTYVAGFEKDWRDAYPGINAVSLMEQLDPIDARQAELLPVVRFAVGQRFKPKAPDYWDYATLLELGVLARDQAGAAQCLADVLTATREPWEPETTARNLCLIRTARSRRNEATDWIMAIEDQLIAKANTFAQTRH